MKMEGRNAVGRIRVVNLRAPSVQNLTGLILKNLNVHVLVLAEQPAFFARGGSNRNSTLAARSRKEQ